MLFNILEVIERPIVCFSFHSRITERIRFAISDDLMLLHDQIEMNNRHTPEKE